MDAIRTYGFGVLVALLLAVTLAAATAPSSIPREYTFVVPPA